MVSKVALIKTVEAAGAIFEASPHCYRASAPTGYCWEQGLHELVANIGRMDMTEAEARQELSDRVCEYGRVERCIDQDCEWCI